jgi:hypothetical protein
LGASLRLYAKALLLRSAYQEVISRTAAQKGLRLLAVLS